MLYPTWLSAMVTMRWGTLKPARVASLGTGKESVFPNAPCRVATRMITTAPAPRMSPNRRRDLCAAGATARRRPTQLGVGKVLYRQGRPLRPTPRVRRIEPTG